MPRLGERIEAELDGTYTLERELTGGGMSRVFLAEERRLGRRVVLKVVAPELGDGISAERFAREIQFAARLQQANIVPVLTTGQLGTATYYTMPFIAGKNLRELLAEGPVPIQLAVSILRDVARALAYAHDEGVAHRDIKPENVLLSGDTAVVTDFGIAKALAASATPLGSATLTQIGTALGTPAYMSPEQAAAGEIDHRSDIYAWGILAYELLSGEHPFAGSRTSQAYLAAHLVERPAPLHERCRTCGESLSQMVMRCLEKDPDQRPQSAREILGELDTGVTPAGGTRPAAPAPQNEVKERAFQLTDDVCRRVDRALLDPRIIDARMHWLDNGVTSDTLVVLIHGTGLDAWMFREVLERIPYRAVAPTFLGFEPENRARIPLTLDAHIALIREFIGAVREEVKPSRTILLGFSSGGDVVLRLVAGSAPEALEVDGIIALGTNLGLETCWLTRGLSTVHARGEGPLLEDLRALSVGSRNLWEWINVHHYLVRVLRKFVSDMEPLRTVAAGFVRPFEERGRDVFPEWFREVAEKVKILLCVNDEEPTTRALIQELRMRNLDSGILGPRFTSDSLVLEEDTDHFDLIAPRNLDRYLDQVISRLNGSAAPVITGTGK
jgi:pimeloyl-ACP methyl ester carboxylesterase